MAALKDLESWKTLLNAATIRNHEPILEIAKTLEEGELPRVFYHRQCRSIFTLKRNLDKLAQLDAKDSANCNSTDSRRSSVRQPTANPSRIYQRVCIFCDKDKYTRNSRTREELIQCVDMRADETIRKFAVGKNDLRMLAVVSRELVAAKACYHKSCYRNYTRNIAISGEKKEDSGYTEYSRTELQGYEKLFNYIRTDLLQNPRIVKLSELYTMFTSFVNSQGELEILESTRTHFRRSLEKEFRDAIDFEDLYGNNRIFAIPRNLSRLDLAKQVTEKSNTTSPNTSDVSFAALILREAIQAQDTEASWPPKPSDLTENAVNIPEVVKKFLYTLMTGSTNVSEMESYSPRTHRLMLSLGQDLIFAVSGGRQRPPKHILLPYAVKSLTNNVDLIQILNRCGHGVAYSQLEEINTALCLQKMSATPGNEVPLPENICPFVGTTLAWENIDRLEETLSGGGTSHRVNGIAVQAVHFGPQLPPASVPAMVKSKKRSIDTVDDANLPIYNAGNRRGPPSRRYVEVTSTQILEDAWKKNLLWLLARLHSCENQTIPNWTGFNILVRNKHVAAKDSVGYLPTPQRSGD